MRRVAQIMGMPVSLDIPGCDEIKIFTEVFKELRAIDEQFSPFKGGSELSRFRRGELSDSRVSIGMKHIMKACLEAEEETDGYFSAFYYSEPTISYLDAVQGSNEKRARRIQQYVERAVEEDDAAMRQKPASMPGSARQQGRVIRDWRKFDPTGYVKGWAIAAASDIIKKSGWHTFCLSAGGDVNAKSDDDKTWRIGIQDPRDKKSVLEQIIGKSFAVATSGNYEKGDHIINPRTGKPAQELLSLSVVGPDIIRADILATAAYAMGHRGLKFIASKAPGYEVLAVDNTGKVIMSKGMNRPLIV